MKNAKLTNNEHDNNELRFTEHVPPHFGCKCRTCGYRRIAEKLLRTDECLNRTLPRCDECPDRNRRA